MQRLNKSSQPGRMDARTEFWSIWISLPAGKTNAGSNTFMVKNKNKLVRWFWWTQILTRELVSRAETLCPLRGRDPAGHTDHARLKV